MNRDDFIWTIGYQGDTAIVDGAARSRNRGKTATALLEMGLYRPAFCAALFDGELDSFRNAFATATGVTVDSNEALKRVFGIFEIPDDVTKVNRIS